MKWAGISYSDLMDLPAYYMDTIIEMMHEEVQALERAKNG